MKVFETAFWALKALKRSAGAKPAAPAPPESQTEFTARTADLSAGIPHYNKGLILERRGEKQSAIPCYVEAVRAVPHYFDAHANLARLLCEAERWDDAIKHAEMAVRLKRNSPRVHNNLSVAYYHKGNIPKAFFHSLTAFRLAPGDADLFENLAQIRESHPELEHAPGAAETMQLCQLTAQKLYDDGFPLLEERKVAEAIVVWKQAIRLAPCWPEAMCNLAAILAIHPEYNIRQPKEALELARKAMELGDGSPRYYDALAAAYASAGRFMEARRTLEQILPTLKTKGPLESAEKLSAHLKLYQERTPLRQELPLFRPPSNNSQSHTTIFRKHPANQLEGHRRQDA